MFFSPVRFSQWNVTGKREIFPPYGPNDITERECVDDFKFIGALLPS